MIFQTQFGSHRVVDLDFDADVNPSCTHQSFAKQTDINLIMARYQKTGIVEHLNVHNGEYGDYLSADDYHASVNAVLAAQDCFMSLPSSIRSRFENDPAKFLAFVDDPKNVDEMINMGLATARPDSSISTDVVSSVQGSDV